MWRRRGDGVELLVLHRAHHGPDYAGEWAWTPPSGARLPGEPLDECARRELLEETGLDLPCVRSDLSRADWAIYEAEAPHDADIRLDPEHDAFAWLPPDEAAARCLPPIVAEPLRAFAARRGGIAGS